MPSQWLDTGWLAGLFLVWVRVGGLFLLAPPFSSRLIPSALKAFLSLIIALMIFTALGAKPVSLALVPYGLAILQQMLVGFILGLLGLIFFAVIRAGGEIIDVQMGLGIATLLEPGRSGQASLISEFQYMAALMIFFSIQGHHSFILALLNSFKTFPLLSFSLPEPYSVELIKAFSQILMLGFRISAPIVVSLLVVELASGIIARMIPQLNILILGIPFKLALGLLGLIMLTPLLYSHYFNLLEKLIKLMSYF